jgi:hypothetical protein
MTEPPPLPSPTSPISGGPPVTPLPPSEEPPIAPPRPRRSRRRSLIAAVAIVVVAILAVSTLLATGVIALGSPPQSAAGSLSPGSALSRSEATAATVPGGPWFPRLEAGFASTTGLSTLPSILLSRLPGCSVAFQRPFRAPPSASALSDGLPPEWIVAFTSENGSQGLLVETTAQSSSPLATITGGCLTNLTGAASLESAGAVSTNLIVPRYAANVTAFMAGRTTITGVFILVGVTFGPLGAIYAWALAWSTCPTSLTSLPTQGAVLTILANAQTGATLVGPSVQTLVC